MAPTGTYAAHRVIDAAEGIHPTWRIPRSEFLVLYVIGMVAVAAILAVLKYVLAGPSQGDRSLLQDLEPEQIALLSNDDAAVAAALAALESTRADLVRRRLLMGPFRRLLLRARFLLPLALTVVGVARVVAEWQNHGPLTQILLEMFIMAAATWVSFSSGRKATRTARPARKALDHLRLVSAGLEPSALLQGPADRDTIRARAPMSVALFSTAALKHADPGLDEALGIPLVTVEVMPAHHGSSSGPGSSARSTSSSGSGDHSCGG